MTKTHTKTHAIKRARLVVGELYQWGGQWRFASYDASVNARRESTPRPYAAAQEARAAALVYAAVEALTGDRGAAWDAQYLYLNDSLPRGRWESYITDGGAR